MKIIGNQISTFSHRCSKTYPHLCPTVAKLICFIFVLLSCFFLSGCSPSDSVLDDKQPPETIRIKYLPITDEESFSGYHWIKYSNYWEDERFGIFTNTQTANVIMQTFKQDADGTFIIDYSQPDTIIGTYRYLEPRFAYRQANIYYENYYNVDFQGCLYSYDYDNSPLPCAYVSWRFVYIGTDWEFYQPLFHVYKIYYNYIENNLDETITFYRCNFTYRLHYNVDWLAELSENPGQVPTYE